MEAKRTNYIKISLTNEEFDSIQRYSENINKPISTAIRNIIEVTVDVPSAFGTLQKEYNQMKNTQEGKNIQTAFDDAIQAMPLSQRLETYIYINKLNALADFANDWKTKDKKVTTK
jgi:hypothetical protein